jgi:hypothetical protein
VSGIAWQRALPRHPNNDTSAAKVNENRQRPYVEELKIQNDLPIFY